MKVSKDSTRGSLLSFEFLVERYADMILTL